VCIVLLDAVMWAVIIILVWQTLNKVNANCRLTVVKGWTMEWHWDRKKQYPGKLIWSMRHTKFQLVQIFLWVTVLWKVQIFLSDCCIMTGHSFFYPIKNVRISTHSARLVVHLHTVVLKTRKLKEKCVQLKIFFSIFFIYIYITFWYDKYLER
jgi:uncharacterized RDD family membrane protein YckC